MVETVVVEMEAKVVVSVEVMGQTHKPPFR